MKKFQKNELHSGSKHGPLVKNKKQAVAVLLAEKRKAEGGDKEYQSVGPTNKTKKKMFGQ